MSGFDHAAANRQFRTFGTTIVLATLSPTLFVLSQNWYAVSWGKAVWLLSAALLAGFILAVLIEGLARIVVYILAYMGRARSFEEARRFFYPLTAAIILSLLFFRSLQPAFPSPALHVAFCIAFAVALIAIYGRGGHAVVNTFLAILSLVSASSWLMEINRASVPKLSDIRQDFETVQFKTRPNIYLFIYDAYGSKSVYDTLFDFDNEAHYEALVQQGFKVLHTFSNYDSTWQTTVGTFIGAHHYLRLEFGNDDTRIGRPMMAMMSHNPVLETLKSNGYRLQQIHGLDYFVNERGQLDFIYPDEAMSSALRLFDLPLLNKLGGRKRKVSIEAQSAVLYDRLARPPSESSPPWFTFSHVNLPAHAPGLPWHQLQDFEQVFRDRTKLANKHMLETINRIKAADPSALILIFGDHGAMRYNKIWRGGDPNEEFKHAGVTPETIGLDRYGIMIALDSSGRCDDYIYPTMTPVNIMRSVFACLSENPGLMANRPADISLFGGSKGRLRLTARDGQLMPTWETYDPKP